MPLHHPFRREKEILGGEGTTEIRERSKGAQQEGDAPEFRAIC